MSDVVGVVVAHGDMAASMIRAAEEISGVRGALSPISNLGCTPEELSARVETAVGEGPAIIFVDLASGSCAFAGRALCMRSPRVAVVTGVSLSMLLDFVFHRDMELETLSRRLVAKGRAGTTLHLPGESSRADQPVSD
ncbi:MAG: PTS sugar transporter subunit IIA [Gemmatimonadota bacterium]